MNGTSKQPTYPDAIARHLISIKMPCGAIYTTTRTDIAIMLIKGGGARIDNQYFSRKDSR
mgnify:CR=1 FL=1